MRLSEHEEDALFEKLIVDLTRLLAPELLGKDETLAVAEAADAIAAAHGYCVPQPSPAEIFGRRWPSLE